MILCLGTTPTVQRTMVFAKLTPDAVNRATEVTEYASGKSANVARVLHTLGTDVLEMGFLGGLRGEFFREDFSRAGIPHDFIEVPGQTRLCTTLIDRSSGVVTELVEESPKLPEQAYETLLERYAAAVARAEMVVLSGSLPPGAPQDFYVRCIQLTGKGKRVILDAVGQPLTLALEHRPFLIKPNAHEVGKTLGIDIHSEPALRDGMKELVHRGATWVIVTRGSADTLVTDGTSFWKVNTPKVDAVSPIGSGDSFAAGVAYGLSQKQSVPHACMLGAACGAANALTPHSGLLYKTDVDRLLPQVKVEPL